MGLHFNADSADPSLCPGTASAETEWIRADKIRTVTQALATEGLSLERHSSEHGRAMRLLTLIL
jgi:hypothetical protein